MAARILIADDNVMLSQLLEDILIEEGYQVETATDGDELLHKAQQHVPDLMLIDVLMPHLDGYEAVRQLRNDTRLAHVPMLLLTARTAVEDVVAGFETGADDYITKPFQIPELLARIKAQLLRASRRPVQNPLTGLPGNTLIEEEVKHRLRTGEPFALLYTDLDNFKAFNDTYGFARGDQIITLVAGLLGELREAHGAEQVFLGHVGGDDFAVIVAPALIAPFCTTLIERFDREVLRFYDPEDVARGYLRGVDRFNAARRFPIQSLSIGVVSTEDRPFDSYEEVSRCAADMKHAAKKIPGSVYIVDRRAREAAAAAPEERRGKPPVVCLVNDDFGSTLALMLADGLRGEHYEVVEYRDQARLAAPPELIAVISPNPPPIVQHVRMAWPAKPVVVVSADARHEEATLALGVEAFLEAPLQIKDFVALVGNILRMEVR
ncbi:MAG TPA: response regulator [Herpetosiphonaceae bacterium]